MNSIIFTTKLQFYCHIAALSLNNYILQYYKTRLITGFKNITTQYKQRNVIYLNYKAKFVTKKSD